MKKWILINEYFDREIPEQMILDEPGKTLRIAESSTLDGSEQTYLLMEEIEP